MESVDSIYNALIEDKDIDYTLSMLNDIKDCIEDLKSIEGSKREMDLLHFTLDYDLNFILVKLLIRNIAEFRSHEISNEECIQVLKSIKPNTSL